MARAFAECSQNKSKLLKFSFQVKMKSVLRVVLSFALCLSLPSIYPAVGYHSGRPEGEGGEKNDRKVKRKPQQRRRCQLCVRGTNQRPGKSERGLQGAGLASSK